MLAPLEHERSVPLEKTPAHAVPRNGLFNYKIPEFIRIEGIDGVKIRALYFRPEDAQYSITKDENEEWKGARDSGLEIPGILCGMSKPIIFEMTEGEVEIVSKAVLQRAMVDREFREELRLFPKLMQYLKLTDGQLAVERRLRP
jgi:hypothetical protein